MDLSTFPQSLSQPKKGFRFALDSLLLASFAQPKNNWKILDLGCGCGVIGLALILKNIQLSLKVWGMDIDLHMLVHLRQNLQKTKIKNYFPFIGDIKNCINIFKKGEFFDQILLNPPYRLLNTGKLSPYENKNQAKFEQKTTLNDFIQGAKFLLKNKKELLLCYLSEQLDYLMEVLVVNRFRVKELLFIYPRLNHYPKIVLVKAIKNGNPGLKVLPPLILYAHPTQNIYTLEAKSFCPFLK
ncbi:MAG: tRNA1Val (adenine37-N6)-methyltransferase [Desulfonauticus sp.]|jgi:tRNA1Val (adenine37-N6)-methyltransferase|nr:MAG: Methyltransferase type 11 [Desulfonauticus sp. 38_4375]MDK2920865.1 tRNA1Val (adenine37-N6)-methyltransferase [Desulfonauticus sp.]